LHVIGGSPVALVSWKDEAELNGNALAAYRSLRKMAFPTKKPWVVAFRYIRDEWTSTWNALTRKRSYAEIQKETIKFRRAEISVHFVGVWELWRRADHLAKATGKMTLICKTHRKCYFG
jgi:hypothetical protein